MLMRTSLALLITLAACGSSSGTPIDAATQVDASAATVVAVTCPATTPLTVTADDSQMTKFTFTPAANPPLPVGSIVTFTMSATHNVIPKTTASTDVGLQVNFRETKCLQFTKAGSFSFICQPHGFTGTITIQ